MEQPYEKCLENGPESLSDAELLAVILRCGARGKTSLELAREILSLPGKEEVSAFMIRLPLRIITWNVSATRIRRFFSA